MTVAPELGRERDYLAGARAQLARMREQTMSLEAQGGDPISSERLAATLNRRARSLVDDPTSSLFFGRIDQQRSSAAVRKYAGQVWPALTVFHVDELPRELTALTALADADSMTG